MLGECGALLKLTLLHGLATKKRRWPQSVKYIFNYVSFPKWPECRTLCLKLQKLSEGNAPGALDKNGDLSLHPSHTVKGRARLAYPLPGSSVHNPQSFYFTPKFEILDKNLLMNACITREHVRTTRSPRNLGPFNCKNSITTAYIHTCYRGFHVSIGLLMPIVRKIFDIES